MTTRALYSRLAEYYDRIYWWKDYEHEVEFLERLFKQNDVAVKRILEVACGTGNHTKLLTSRGYRVTGVDISADVLRIAKRKVKRGARFVVGDMRNLDAVLEGGEEEDDDDGYDAVLCLFSAISYNVTVADLKRTLKGFHSHAREGGIVIFDTHFTKRSFADGHRSEDIFDDGNVFGARLGLSRRSGDTAELSFSYLIKDGRRVIELRDDVHRLGLYDSRDFLKIMGDVGFTRTRVYSDWSIRKKKKRRDSDWFADRIYTGIRPLRA